MEKGIAEASAAAPSRRQPASGARAVGLDVARGALMAYIISVIHGVFWFGILPPRAASWLLFEMPPVFIITGLAFYYAERMRGRPSPYFTYLLRRAVRILVPYFAYALTCAVLVLTLRHADGGPSLSEIGAALAAWLNPATRGAGHTMWMLSWHLWFVPPFLVVTALLPWLAPRRVWAWVRPWMLAGAGALLMLAVHQIRFPYNEIVQNAVFYLLWALFGVVLALAPRRFKTQDYALVLVLALAGIGASYLISPSALTLDMQANKFPPNAIFFLFSCAWVMWFLVIARGLSESFMEKLARMPLLGSFIRSGYSIYLWQGVGYTAALMIGRPLGLNVYLMWLTAIAITIVLGLIAAPLERIRLGH
jgi:peptidoglycan/LPS O-acetylase OafA/YrhL